MTTMAVAKQATLKYRDHGPRHFFKALTDPVLAAYPDATRSAKDFTVTVPADARKAVAAAWDAALADMTETLKQRPAYQRADRKDPDGRKLRYDMEQKFLSAAVKKALS
jgi:hypothetical protein